jgi:hypothetical protein
MRFSLRPCDEGFFATAPARYVGTIDVPLPADRIWADLTSDDTLAWCRVISRARWTSPRPFGVGTTRTVRLRLGLLTVDEVYFRWEEGRRQSFYVSQASLPLIRRFAEDYLVEETTPGSSRLTWTIAAEPYPAARPGAPVNALLARSLFGDTRRHFGTR